MENRKRYAIIAPKVFWVTQSKVHHIWEAISRVASFRQHGTSDNPF